MRQSVTNFLDNLGYPVVIVNDLLQLKLTQGARDTARSACAASQVGRCTVCASK